MKLACCYPKPNELLENEFGTLQFCKDNFFFNQTLEVLADDANKYHSSKYNIFKNRVKNFEFNFESKFTINADTLEGIVYVGAKILKSGDDIGNVTYYVAICKEEQGKKKILRKYHFDYNPASSTQGRDNSRNSHPTFHLQYAGKLSPELEKLSMDDSHMDTWLSEPRLCYSPISLALLINLVFKEFPGEMSRRLIERSEWRNLIKKNEDLILAPFFKKCQMFFSHREQKKVKGLFTNDFYYGH